MTSLRAELYAAGATHWYDAKDLDRTDPWYLEGSTAGVRPRRPARALTARHPQTEGAPAE